MEKKKMKCKNKKLLDGDSVATPAADIAKLKVPPWYEEKKFNRAKELCRNHFTAFAFSHFCGLLLFFYFPKITKILMFTGASSTKSSNFHRHLMTIRHIQKWYEGDVWDVNDSAHRSLSIVRSMHARVAKDMVSLNDGVVYMSQWDMAVGQWALVAPIVLFPSLVGAHGWTTDDYEAIIHFWRTIGYLLGIEDEYNLCKGDYNQVITAFKKMLREDYRPMLKKADPVAVAMAKSVTEAMSMMEPLYTWPALATYIYELVGLPCPVGMGIIDNICYRLLHFILTFLMKFHRLRIYVNKFTLWKLVAAEKKDLQLRGNERNSFMAGTMLSG